MASLLNTATFLSRKADGTPNALGRVYTYAAGTLTPQASYTTQAGNIARTNPVILDADGTATIWLDPSLSYRIIEKTAGDVTIRDTDNIVGSSISDLASTAPGKGSALVRWLRAAVSAVAATVQNRLDWLPFNAFEFMTVPQIAAVQAYSFANDNTPALQAAINAANLAGRTLEVPAGGYKIVGNLFIANPATYGICKIVGAGISNPFAIGGNHGTQWRQFIAATTLQFTSPVLAPTNIQIDISGIAFYSIDASLVSPVVYFKGFYGVCRFDGNVIYQSGTGAGLQIDYATTSSITNNYFLNRDCVNAGSAGGTASFATNVMTLVAAPTDGAMGVGHLVLAAGVAAGTTITSLASGALNVAGSTYTLSTAPGTIATAPLSTQLGPTRVGTGLYINQQFDSGLLTVEKNTARGWLTGFQFGVDGGSGRMYNLAIRDCEASTVYNGIYLADTVQKAEVDNTYGEGGEGGVFITDNGFYNNIENAFSFPGFRTHILSTASSFGGTYNNNHLSLSAALPATRDAIGIDLRGQTFAKSANHNTFTFGGSGGTIPGVVGLKLSGTSPALNFIGNTFNPAGWAGGTGTKAIVDNTITGLGAGSGWTGFGQVIDPAGIVYPYTASGAYNVAPGGTLTQANVAAGVLTLTVASDFIMTATGAAGSNNVTSITAPNIEGKLFWIRCTNNVTTFTNGANLKMSGGVNYTPGASGATLLFKCNGGVCWEQSRTAY